MNVNTMITEAELENYRADTPSVEKRIHFDNAGASPMPTPTYDKIVDFMKLERDLGGYTAMRQCAEDFQGLYQSLAELIGASPEEIAFAESATRAWDMAFYSVPFNEGDIILCSSAEYSSNYLAFLQVKEKFGVEIKIVPDNQSGTMDLTALKDMLNDRVRMVSVCHIPTSNGLISDVEEIGAILKDHPALYFLDACQSAGQLPIDVKKIGCDVLTSTGRKYLRGPRGTGFLYIRKSILEDLTPPFLDIRAAEWLEKNTYKLRNDAKRFEGWESSYSCRLGFKAAVDYALQIGIERIQQRVQKLAATLREQLKATEGIIVWDKGENQSGLVVFTIEGTNAYDIRDKLSKMGITVTALDNTDARLEFGDQELVTRLRASVHYYNTEAEIQLFMNALKDMI